MVQDSQAPAFLSGSQIHETFRQLEWPQLEKAQELAALWKRRPQDGFLVGRDFPSRPLARHLAHVLIWEPISGGADYRLYLAGELLRWRFGGHAVGQKFSDLIDPAIVPFFTEKGRSMLKTDLCACYEIHLTRQEPLDGQKDLHFELVIFPIWSPGRRCRWLVNGLYYFPSGEK